jgi:sugar phosphate isomerase/epimerase
MAENNPLDDAIAASHAAAAASRFLSRVLERQEAGKLTPDEVRDQGAEAIAMILDAAERMRAAVIAYHSGNPRKTGF